MRNDLKQSYTWFGNRPDSNSDDFKNVMAWLKSHGAPDPKIVYITLDSGGFPPGTVNPGPIMFLQYPGMPNPSDASAVLNTPGTILVELGITSATILYEPPAPPPPPVLLPGQPANPIGAKWFVNAAGHQVYYLAPGDHLPDGTTWPGTGVVGEYVYVKHLTPGPWGDYASWEQLR